MTRATPNRLASETSPYLLQHAHNPVEWYPWGEEALQRARDEERPIFLSVGYSACHWCHVMEAESFEDERTAAALNEHFVNIKVDREERPDLDEIYMKAVQAFSGGHGGWPMSVFLTPELEPFYGGTYFPPTRRQGQPAFIELVQGIARYWREDRADALKRGSSLREAIARDGGGAQVGALAPDLLRSSQVALEASYDERWGGWGQAPKFPHATDARICLRHGLRSGDEQPTRMALHTLERMALGGIRDQLGLGFARYSTDAEWRVPHFEKMLYDNALLVPAFLEAWLVSGEALYADVARETCGWMLDEMRTPEGAFASSLDADTEGEEGRFYVWTRAEFEEVLGAERGAQAAAWFDVTPAGNFEHGKSVLWCPRPAAQVAQELGLSAEELRSSIASARSELLAARAQRVAPAQDDKVLAAWNGLALSALAQSYQVLEDERFLEGARAAARYLLEGLRQADGRLYATARAGRAHLNAYLDDYAFVIAGLLDLYESDFDANWLQEALALEEIVQDRFEDGTHGGFFTTARDHERLLARMRSPHDGALPSGNAVHALNLMRLSQLCGAADFEARAERALQSVGAMANQYPQAFSQLMLAVDHQSARPRELVVAGHREDPATAEMLRVVRSSFSPQRVVALSDGALVPELSALLEGRTPPASGAEVHICRSQSCQLPLSRAEELRAALSAPE